MKRIKFEDLAEVFWEDAVKDSLSVGDEIDTHNICDSSIYKDDKGFYLELMGTFEGVQRKCLVNLNIFRRVSINTSLGRFLAVPASIVETVTKISMFDNFKCTEVVESTQFGNIYHFDVEGEDIAFLEGFAPQSTCQ